MTGEWYELQAPWDNLREAEHKLMKLGESSEWCDLVDEVSGNTHATADEVWNGMADAIRTYLESLE